MATATDTQELKQAYEGLLHLSPTMTVTVEQLRAVVGMILRALDGDA